VNQKNLVSALIALLTISMAAPIAVTNAAPWPQLPTTTVHMTAVYGTSSYFIITLSGVPAGYDVSNKAYPGWCIQRQVSMIRGVSHDVKLYSSLAPPSTQSGKNWVAINYILNHKQGTRMDIQNAIWYFTNGITPSSLAALAMVAEAQANPNYDPSTAPILAVILQRQTYTGVQNTIIELSRPAKSGLSPGFWKHNVNVYNGESGAYSSQEYGMPHETKSSMEGYAASIIIENAGTLPAEAKVSPEAFLAWSYQMYSSPVNRMWWLPIANMFNEAAGRAPYSE
jgi:hypothetical protein